MCIHEHSDAFMVSFVGSGHNVEVEDAARGAREVGDKFSGLVDDLVRILK
jgi:hypothetical protein